MIIKTVHAAAVVGGVNMDIGGKTLSKPIPADSNPGVISAAPGGVGRNIAQNLRTLGLDVSLVAAMGEDMYALAIEKSCAELGIDLSMAAKLPGERSSCYLYVADEQGEMRIGISDMDIVKKISPEYLRPLLPRLNGFDALVLDANLREDSILTLAEGCTGPLYADPVSTVKAVRLLKALPRLRAIKPNSMEAEALTGERDMEKAARALLEAGVERVFISLGPDGLLAAEKDKLIMLPCVPGEVINTTGAGDAAMAAIVWADLNKMSLEDTARAALLAGSITCAHQGANTGALVELKKILPL